MNEFVNRFIVFMGYYEAGCQGWFNCCYQLPNLISCLI